MFNTLGALHHRSATVVLTYCPTSRGLQTNHQGGSNINRTVLTGHKLKKCLRRCGCDINKKRVSDTQTLSKVQYHCTVHIPILLESHYRTCKYPCTPDVIRVLHLWWLLSVDSERPLEFVGGANHRSHWNGVQHPHCSYLYIESSMIGVCTSYHSNDKKNTNFNMVRGPTICT